MCKCGCRGWCTFYELFSFLHWSFCALAAGVFPTARHDQRAWMAEDGDRMALAGLDMSARGALVYIKGDWFSRRATHDIFLKKSLLRGFPATREQKHRNGKLKRIMFVFCPPRWVRVLPHIWFALVGHNGQPLLFVFLQPRWTV